MEIILIPCYFGEKKHDKKHKLEDRTTNDLTKIDSFLFSLVICYEYRQTVRFSDYETLQIV